ncbi:MAG: LysM domain-containing protein [Chloroflexota bacterium]
MRFRTSVNWGLWFVLILTSLAKVNPAASQDNTPQPSFSATPTALPDGRIVYQVAAGDTLWVLAYRFQVDIETLYRNNGLTPDSVLQIGQEIVLGFRPQPQSAGGSIDLPTPTATATPSYTPTPLPTPTAIPTQRPARSLMLPTPTAAPPPTPIAAGEAAVDPGAVGVLGGLLVLLGAAGGLFLYLVRRYRQ